MAIRYNPGAVPIFYGEETRQVARFLEEELSKLQEALNNIEVESIRFTILNNAIGKPRNGDVAYADGTNWNPGSGAGLYEYVGGSWSKL